LLDMSSLPNQPPSSQLHPLRNLILGFGDKGGEFATSDIRGYHDPPLAVFTADLVWAGREIDLGEFRKRDVTDLPQRRIAPQGGSRPGWVFQRGQWDRQRPNCVDVRTQMFGKPDDDIEALVAFKNPTLASSRNGDFHQTLHICDIDPEPRQSLPVD